MYLQLREQFEEKSTILNETRKELFRLQEQLAAIQKEQEEQQFTLFSEEETLWMQNLHRLSLELEQIQKEHATQAESL